MCNEEKISEQLKQRIQELKSPNIAVIGRTGTGKSTLIKKIFGIEDYLADAPLAGSGLPITQSFQAFTNKKSDEDSPDPLNQKSDEDSPVVIYDSPGYELTKELEWFENVKKFLKEKKAQGLKEQIHLIWYVINAASARVEYFEKDILVNITEQHVPVVIVLTQCDRAKSEEIQGVKTAFKELGLKTQEITEEFTIIKQEDERKKPEQNSIFYVIETSADPLVIHGKPISEPKNLKLLVNLTVELLPEIYAEAVLVMQVTDLESKKRVIWNYIATAATACFAGAIIPVPGSAPAAALASQSGLCIKIASVYGYTEHAEFVMSISSFTVTTLNNLVLSGIMDLVGTFFPPTAPLTGAISASYVTAIGLTYASVFENLAKANIHGRGREAVENFLKENFRKEFSRHAPKSIPTIDAMRIIGEDYIKG